MKTELLQADRSGDVRRAARLLREGAVIAFPTETVYGLGARADDAAAVAELRRLKDRPQDKPFSLLVPSAEAAWRHGTPGPAARALAATFWPGPLTLVVPDGQGGWVGVRCPACGAALAMLRETGVAVAAPSANRSGEPPALTPSDVLRDFDGRIAAVLDGGPVELGIVSTVARVTGDSLDILREGAIGERELRAAARGAV